MATGYAVQYIDIGDLSFLDCLICSYSNRTQLSTDNLHNTYYQHLHFKENLWNLTHLLVDYPLIKMMTAFFFIFNKSGRFCLISYLPCSASHCSSVGHKQDFFWMRVGQKTGSRAWYTAWSFSLCDQTRFSVKCLSCPQLSNSIEKHCPSQPH